MQRALERFPAQQVLFETFENGVAIGHTASFFEVSVPTPRPLHAELHRVLLLDTDGERLLGKL